MSFRRLLPAALALTAIAATAAALTMERPVTFARAHGDLALYSGDILLPATADWLVSGFEPAEPRGEAYLTVQSSSPEGRLCSVLVARPKSAPARFAVRLDGRGTRQTLLLVWDVSTAAPGDGGLEKALREGRQREWAGLLPKGGAPALDAWLTAYGQGRAANAQGGEARTLSALRLLGGRAAIEETLQMQAIEAAQGGAPAAPVQVQTNAGVVTIADPKHEPTVALDTVPGVKVAAHPYGEMLAGRAGGRLPLANSVPPDRFLVYMADPAAILRFLDSGASFLGQAGTALTGSSLAYGLGDRYLAELGIGKGWLRAIVGAGLLGECAIFAPDLFFIDGTDVTVISRIAKRGVLEPMLKLAGVAGVGVEGAVKHTSASGRVSYWLLLDDDLVIGTNPGEIRRVADLRRNKGAGSLGASAEFRYMLTQLPLTPQTFAMTYCSDPFIRRLTGPEVKIGQLRRLRARAAMERASAMALLARKDGHPAANSIERLIADGYLPADFARRGIRLNPDLTAVSDTYGTAAAPTSLLAAPVDKATPAEAEAYAAYRDNYERYWRQFFDPIAARLDQTAEGAYELTVFILPLIDNSAYNALREGLVRGEDATPLKIPRLEPEPVAMLSLGLSPRLRAHASGPLARMGAAVPGVDATALLGIGPGIHLAVHDSDPVLPLGSGDILGAFDAGAPRWWGEPMLIVPAIATALTRPCTLCVEAEHPDQVRRALVALAQSDFEGRRGMRELDVEAYQETGGDTWVLSFSLAGLFKFRLGLDVSGRYLLIRNLPWSTPARMAGTENAALSSAALRAAPAACVQQRAALGVAAGERDRAVALSGAAALYPLVAAGEASIPAALARHAALFGSAPVHPAGGEWVVRNGRVESSAFGTAAEPRQPQPGAAGCALLDAVARFGVAMQFEQTGLRTQLRWELAPAAAKSPARPAGKAAAPAQ